MINGPIIPGRLSVNVALSDGPTAQPIVVPLNTPNGLQVMVAGGLTKLEHVAAILAASIPQERPVSDADVVRRAAALLDECKRQQLASPSASE